MPGIIVLIALFSIFNGFSPRMHKVSYLAGGEESSFTLAQRTRSFRPRTSSVISVPLCFKTSTPDRRLSLAGLANRKRERKVARTQSRKDFELRENPLRLRAVARREDKNTEARRTRSFGSRMPSVISVPLCFNSSCAETRSPNMGTCSRPVATLESKRWKTTASPSPKRWRA